jgi:hypothetical protein
VKKIHAAAPKIETCLTPADLLERRFINNYAECRTVIAALGAVYQPLSVHPLHEMKHHKEDNKLSGSE